jgi:hypothetical protein
MLAGKQMSRITMCSLLILPQLAVSSPVVAVDRPLPDITICYNYSCKRTENVRPAAGEWQEVVNQFIPAARSAAEEREMIRRAIGILERIAGTQTPTYRDRGRNPVVDDWPGQMDCIDESINTMRYLDLLQERGLLHWHHAVGRAYRAPYIFDQHWAGQIIELETLEYYAVDSWYLDNGNAPYIQAINEWRRKDPFQGE